MGREYIAPLISCEKRTNKMQTSCGKNDRSHYSNNKASGINMTGVIIIVAVCLAIAIALFASSGKAHAETSNVVINIDHYSYRTFVVGAGGTVEFNFTHAGAFSLQGSNLQIGNSSGGFDTVTFEYKTHVNVGDKIIVFVPTTQALTYNLSAYAIYTPLITR
jgi:hypothetical protein